MPRQHKHLNLHQLQDKYRYNRVWACGFLFNIGVCYNSFHGHVALAPVPGSPNPTILETVSTRLNQKRMATLSPLMNSSMLSMLAIGIKPLSSAVSFLMPVAHEISDALARRLFQLLGGLNFNYRAHGIPPMGPSASNTILPETRSFIHHAQFNCAKLKVHVHIYPSGHESKVCCGAISNSTRPWSVSRMVPFQRFCPGLADVVTSGNRSQCFTCRGHGDFYVKATQPPDH